MNLVFFGMSGPLARGALEALLSARLVPRAIVTPALAGGPIFTMSRLTGSTHSVGRHPLPSLTPLAQTGLAALASAHAIPLLEIGSARAIGTHDAIRAFEPDVIAVACFPWRLPEALLAMPRLGGVNLHPSLLPENRGPDPLFWTFRHGDTRTGVTVHLMTAELDAGPILRQTAIPVEDGLSETVLERRCAETGGRLLVEAVAGLVAGREPTPVPQDERGATYYGQPSALDYVIESDWSARRCENFTRGVIGRGQPVLIHVNGVTYRIVEPLGVVEDELASNDASMLTNGIVTLRRRTGVWRARVAPL